MQGNMERSRAKAGAWANAVLALALACTATMPAGACGVQYQASDSILVTSLLEGAAGLPATANPITYLARELIGVPYVAHTLETNRVERLVVNLREMDCTTYVENVVALYMCVRRGERTFGAFCDHLRSVRYRQGRQPHYLDRLHYFTDWVDDNASMGICREIQSPDPPFTSVQEISLGYMSSHPDRYRALRENPGYLPGIRRMEKAFDGKSRRYIPKSLVGDSAMLRGVIMDGDIIATTTSVGGLDVHHLGIAVWHDDGLHMLNASSLRGKVVEESMTLHEYLARQGTMTGIRVIRLA